MRSGHRGKDQGRRERAHLVPEQDVVRVGDLADKLLPKALHIDGGEAGVVHLQQAPRTEWFGSLDVTAQTAEGRNALMCLAGGPKAPARPDDIQQHIPANSSHQVSGNCATRV